MFDEKLLDGMTFGELNQALDYVLERMGQFEGERAEGEDDPRLDVLYVFANKIVRKMDAIVRESGPPEAIAQWNKVMAGYDEHFKKYTDTLQE